MCNCGVNPFEPRQIRVERLQNRVRLYNNEPNSKNQAHQQSPAPRTLQNSRRPNITRSGTLHNTSSDGRSWVGVGGTTSTKRKHQNATWPGRHGKAPHPGKQDNTQQRKGAGDNSKSKTRRSTTPHHKKQVSPPNGQDQNASLKEQSTTQRDGGHHTTPRAAANGGGGGAQRPKATRKAQCSRPYQCRA